MERGQVELAQGGPGPALLHQGARQAGPGLALPLAQPGAAGGGQRPLQVADGVGGLAQLEGRQPERPLGHAHRVGVAGATGAAHEVEALRVGVARRPLRQQQHGGRLGAQPVRPVGDGRPVGRGVGARRYGRVSWFVADPFGSWRPRWEDAGVPVWWVRGTTGVVGPGARPRAPAQPVPGRRQWTSSA